ncbi:hypothetical protein [Parafrigoribacterium humi]|uniref:hypothetical protein n=1 Tax=Parafrigoribacterium humi TaxID=3144664 RepID=UPI0032EE9DD5
MTSRTPQADDLAYDLAFLRKGEGFTQRRLEQVPLVAGLLRQAEDDSFERVRSRMVSAIGSLDEREAALLMDVFALGPDMAPLTRLQERRKAHAAKVERGIDTVANRETVALQHLVSKLVAGTYAQSPLTLDVPEMHNGIIYETTSTLIVVENRTWKETREHYRFVATFDEMDYLTISRSYPAKATAISGGAFTVNSRETSKGFNDHFWHRDTTGERNEPMRRGEVYDLKFTLEPEEAAEERDTIVNASRAFHERSLLASIQVGFLGEKPSTVWTYQQVSFFAQPGTPNDSNQIQLDDRGVATLRLRDLHGGLFSGIAWTW